MSSCIRGPLLVGQTRFTILYGPFFAWREVSTQMAEVCARSPPLRGDFVSKAPWRQARQAPLLRTMIQAGLSWSHEVWMINPQVLLFLTPPN